MAKNGEKDEKRGPDDAAGGSQSSNQPAKSSNQPASAAASSAQPSPAYAHPPTEGDSIQCQKWKKMMQRGIEVFIADHPDTFQRRVRRGIPMEYRWEVWKAAVRLDDMKPGEDEYLRLNSKENRFSHLITIDISRTFPEYAQFDGEQQQALYRILNAYANLNATVGYCQGMNFIAGLLLLVSKKESETFWMFVRLMEDGKLNGFYKEKFPLLRLYLRAFDQLVAETIPELREHFIAENVQPAVYLHQWFLTLFINCLPLPTVLIIWDVIVCDGLPVILSITVSLLKVLKNVLMNMHFEDIVKFFKTMKAGDEECDATMIGQLLIKQSNRIDIPMRILQSLQIENFDDDKFSDCWEPAHVSPRKPEEGGNNGYLSSYLTGMSKQMSSWWEDRSEQDRSHSGQDSELSAGGADAREVTVRQGGYPKR